MHKTLKERLEALRADLQTLIKEVDDNENSWESDDEDAVNPWEEVSSDLSNADGSLDEAINELPEE